MGGGHQQKEAKGGSAKHKHQGEIHQTVNTRVQVALFGKLCLPHHRLCSVH